MADRDGYQRLQTPGVTALDDHGSVDALNPDPAGTETRWVFEVEDCRKFYDQASKRGVKFVELPVEQAWGVTEAMFEDLYGNVFVVESFRRTAAR